MKLSDYVANWIAEHTSGRVYMVCGAGAMHLNDSICHHDKLSVLAMHHEQACAFAAEADARVSGKPAVVHVTAGPGGTNAITGIAGAFVDSIPMIVIAGQVSSATLAGPELRQLGCNELDLPAMVGPVTKYAVTVRDANKIRFHLDQALHLATTGRPGPVFVEIPLDIQSAEIDPYPGPYFVHDAARKRPAWEKIRQCFALLSGAHRPLLIVGNGVRLAGAQEQLTQAIDCLKIPVVTSWEGADLLDWNSPYAIGRPGVMGDRAGNFAISNADVILALGTRLSIPQIGHSPHMFAPNAKLIMVDIDREEMQKPTLRVDLAIHADAGEFLADVVAAKRRFVRYEWLARCQKWKENYPVMQPQYRNCDASINSYYFMEELAKHLDDDAIIVTDVGAPFISAHQSLKLNGKQRLIHSAGVSAMGWGLPAAIGAWRAGGGRQVVCLAGDGGMMLNLQELQTIAHHNMPIAIFVFANNGYMTMQYTQATHFKREAASSEESGISCPDFGRIAQEFGIPAQWWNNKLDWLTLALREAKNCPFLVECCIQTNQPLIPRIQSRTENGRFVPVEYDDMFPYLDREELASNRVASEDVMELIR